MATHYSDEELRKRLTAEQYRVLRQKDTETPGSGELLYNFEKGMYVCPACGNELFSSDTKYESTTPGLIGWPSFSEAVSKDAVELRVDNTLGMQRSEVVCKRCDSHLGHLFEDPSSPNGQHYCINSASLEFKKQN
jgi:peptide-methionine (R)-S-oxide reductase